MKFGQPKGRKSDPVALGSAYGAPLQGNFQDLLYHKNLFSRAD
jgi:hypothetical protein